MQKYEEERSVIHTSFITLLMSFFFFLFWEIELAFFSFSKAFDFFFLFFTVI